MEIPTDNTIPIPTKDATDTETEKSFTLESLKKIFLFNSSEWNITQLRREQKNENHLETIERVTTQDNLILYYIRSKDESKNKKSIGSTKLLMVAENLVSKSECYLQRCRCPGRAGFLNVISYFNLFISCSILTCVWIIEHVTYISCT